jgi:hypothetical protein
MAQQTAVEINIDNVDSNQFAIHPQNATINIGNAKIVFYKQKIELDEILDVYIKLKSFLNTFKNVNL